MKLFKFILFFIAVLISFETLAEPTLKIENAWVGSTEEGDDMSVAYMSLLSHEDLILTSVTSPKINTCLLYTSPSPRDGLLSRMPSSA